MTTKNPKHPNVDINSCCFILNKNLFRIKESESFPNLKRTLLDKDSKVKIKQEARYPKSAAASAVFIFFWNLLAATHQAQNIWITFVQRRLQLFYVNTRP